MRFCGLINGLVNIREFSISHKHFILVALYCLPRKGLQVSQMYLLHTSPSAPNRWGLGDVGIRLWI